MSYILTDNPGEELRYWIVNSGNEDIVVAKFRDALLDVAERALKTLNSTITEPDDRSVSRTK